MSKEGSIDIKADPRRDYIDITMCASKSSDKGLTYPDNPLTITNQFQTWRIQASISPAATTNLSVIKDLLNIVIHSFKTNVNGIYVRMNRRSTFRKIGGRYKQLQYIKDLSLDVENSKYNFEYSDTLPDITTVNKITITPHPDLDIWVKELNISIGVSSGGSFTLLSPLEDERRDIEAKYLDDVLPAMCIYFYEAPKRYAYQFDYFYKKAEQDEDTELLERIKHIDGIYKSHLENAYKAPQIYMNQTYSSQKYLDYITGIPYSSKYEIEIGRYLYEHDYIFVTEYFFDDLRGRVSPLRFDFAILTSVDDTESQFPYTLVEYQGTQHFDSQNKELIEHDAMKVEYCKKHNIPLIVLWGTADEAINKLEAKLAYIFQDINVDIHTKINNLNNENYKAIEPYIKDAGTTKKYRDKEKVSYRGTFYNSVEEAWENIKDFPYPYSYLIKVVNTAKSRPDYFDFNIVVDDLFKRATGKEALHYFDIPITLRNGTEITAISASVYNKRKDAYPELSYKELLNLDVDINSEDFLEHMYRVAKKLCSSNPDKYKGYEESFAKYEKESWEKEVIYHGVLHNSKNDALRYLGRSTSYLYKWEKEFPDLSFEQLYDLTSDEMKCMRAGLSYEDAKQYLQKKGDI